MYCPKCGGQNSDDLAYCRECGENLKIISQVMKKHLPVALISNLDAAIERKNERIRRDAILWGFWGTVLSILIVFGQFGLRLAPLENVLFVSYFYASSALCILAYIRSKESWSGTIILPRNGLQTSIDKYNAESTSDFFEGTTKELDYRTEPRFDNVYCPKCGEQNADKPTFCRACGINLDFDTRPRGLARYLPAFVVRVLDNGIARYYQDQRKYKTFPRLLLGTSPWLFIAILLLLFLNVSGLFWLLVYLSRIVVHGWDLLEYRRNALPENGLHLPLVDFETTNTNTAFQDLKIYFSESERIAKFALFLALAVLTGFVWYIALSVEQSSVEMWFFGFLTIPIIIKMILDFYDFRDEVRLLSQSKPIKRELKCEHIKYFEPELAETKDLSDSAHYTYQSQEVVKVTTRPLDANDEHFGDEVSATQPLPIKRTNST